MFRQKQIIQRKKLQIPTFSRSITIFANELLLSMNLKANQRDQMAEVKKQVLLLKEHHAKENNFNYKVVKFRGEDKRRTVNDIKEAGGFICRGKMDSIKKHVEYHLDSHYISTSLCPIVAESFAGVAGTVYVIQMTEFYSNVFKLHHIARIKPDSNIKLKNDAINEQELAVIGAIPFSDIISWYDVKTGETYYNKAYQMRSISYEVVSANYHEHEIYFKDAHDKTLLDPQITQGFLSGKEKQNEAIEKTKQILQMKDSKENAPVRSLCLNEAKQLSSEMETLPPKIKGGVVHFNINCMPTAVACDGTDSKLKDNNEFKFTCRLFKEAMFQLNKDKNDPSFYFRKK